MNATLEHIVLFLAVGLIAGFLAGWITKRRGFGLWGNLFIGCLGAAVGGVLFPLIGIHGSGIIGQTVLATLTAVGLLFVINKLDVGSKRK